METRFVEQRLSGITIREAAGEDEPTTIGGYGAVFFDEKDPAGTQYELWAGVVERIMPGAFDDTLERGDDVVGLFNHQPNQVLGRRSADTMAVSVDKRGLLYEIRIGDTSIARDVVEHIRRRDVTGSSIAFRVSDEEWVEQKNEDGSHLEIREIRAIELFDTGPVTFPAYAATTTGLRSAASIVRALGDAAIADAHASHKAYCAQRDAARARIAAARARGLRVREAQLGLH